jgi:hypothetical protein
MFFWAKAPCGLVAGSKRFGEVYSLHLQGEIWLKPTSPHGALAQKNIIKRATTMKIVNLIKFLVNLLLFPLFTLLVMFTFLLLSPSPYFIIVYYFSPLSAPLSSDFL